MLPNNTSEDELDLRLIDVRAQLFLITDEQPSLCTNTRDKEFSKRCFRCLVDDGEIEWDAFSFELTSCRDSDCCGTDQVHIMLQHMANDILPLFSILVSSFGWLAEL